MQKRVVYDFNAQTATESAAENSTDKAVKTSNAIGKLKRAFSGKSFKFVVLIVLLFASLFCTIGSADWIISQQKVVPNVAGNSIFKFDDLGFGAHVNNGKPTENYTFNGSSISISMSVAAVGGVQNLPDSAIEAQNIRYKVKKCASDTKPENLNEEFFNSGYTAVLPKYAGTYAVLITSEADGVSYGKTIKVFTIAPCPVKIEWSGAVGFTYDGTDHSSNITATARTENGAAVKENIFKISFSYKAHGATTFTPVTEVKNAGTYTATAEISNKNYTISSNEAATFTIEQKALTVTAEDKTVTYGDSATYTATYKGLLDCDKGKLGTPNFTCNYNKVGTYSITVDGLENSNYAITYVNGTLTVNARTVTLDWGTDNSFVYDGNAHTLTPTAQNVVNNDNLGLTVTVTGENISGSSAINVGTYTATAQITNENYVLAESSKTATFTITARALTITADNKTVTYGDPVPIYTLTYDGLLDCDKDALGSLVFKCEYTTTSPVGTYPITVNGLASSNYTISYKPGTLTVNPGKITVTVKSKTISYGDFAPTSYDLTCDNADINANISALGTPVFKCDYTTTSPVGKYTIEVSGLTLANYDIGYNHGTLYVKQRQVTVSDWGNTSFTYNGKAQKPEPSFNNVVNGDNLNATVTIIGNKQPIIKGNYTATVTISNDNYKLSGSASTNFTIIPLKIAFNGIIESDYKSGGIALNAELFNGKFKINETIADASSVDLSTVHNDIIGGTAKNFSGNEDTSKPENGFYSYAFGKNITAGSTYLISNITLDPTSNFELTTKSVYLKYKTAKVGDKFYTIEDALAQSGTITLCGDASNDSSYVITAFAKLNNLFDTAFGNYKSDYKYTLSGKTLIIPFEDSLKEKNCLNKINATYGNVYSALVIQNNISITLSNSASITVGAELSYNQRISCALAERHGVLSNNGTITAESGCKVSAYGYIKGTGKIILKSGAIGNDVVSIYDFPGGAVILYNMSKVFPTNAFTLHSNACETYIYSGAKYKGFTYFVLDTPIIGNTGYEATAEIVGANSKSGLFAPTSESGYIVKKVKALSGYDINDISVTNQRISSNTKLQHRDNIEVYGAYKDNTMELSVSTYKFQTSTDKPFPIGLMDITIKTGNLTLEKSSYMVMPGSKIKVENGAKLIVNGKSKLSAIKYDTINSATGNQKYTNYFSTTSDGEIVVNGELTTASTAQVGGKILTTETAASIQLSNSSASYIMLIHTDKSNATLSGTVNAFGNIITKSNGYEQQDLSAGTYYSTKIDSDYVWYKNSATITYHTNGGTLNGTSGNTTQNITLPSGGYISSNLPEPTRPYYEFNGWYYDSALTQKATAIFASCDLYAKWSEKEYTIIFNIPDGFGKFDPIKLYGEHTYNLPTLDTVTKDGQTYYFDNWYLYADYSGTAIKQVSAENANEQNIINVYAFYSSGTYTVKYNENPENLKFANNQKVDKPENQTFDKGKAVSQSELKSLNSYNEKTSFDYYFAGWYLPDSSGTIITSLPSTINGDITLCAKWIKKAQLKIELPVFENGNRTGNTTIYDTHKYFYKQKTDPIGIKNLSTYIDAGYTVPENYKFIGFNASSGFTATQDDSDMNNITTKIEVGATSDVLTITADIRKILKVDITMTATAKYTRLRTTETGDFKINQIIISTNSFYKTKNGDWQISNGNDVKQAETGEQTFFVLEGTTNIKITVDDITVKALLSKHTFTATKIPNFGTTGCTKPANNSPFTFTITNSDATINWSGQATYKD